MSRVVSCVAQMSSVALEGRHDNKSRHAKRHATFIATHDMTVDNSVDSQDFLQYFFLKPSAICDTQILIVAWLSRVVSCVERMSLECRASTSKVDTRQSTWPYPDSVYIKIVMIIIILFFSIIISILSVFKCIMNNSNVAYLCAKIAHMWPLDRFTSLCVAA